MEVLPDRSIPAETLVRVAFFEIASAKGLLRAPESAVEFEAACSIFGRGSAPITERTFGAVRTDVARALEASPHEEALGHLYGASLSGDVARKEGAHYTPRSLTEPIVKQTLEPLLDGDCPWVCDPACGSGAFLLAAARFLSSRFGLGVSEVVQRGLYGVERDPLAAEVARLSLWLLAGESELPLSFADRAVRCGDALVGVVRVEEMAGPVPRNRRQLLLFKQVDACRRAVADVVARRRAHGGLVTWKAMADRAVAAAGSERPFHWLLEFPEVFSGAREDACGFDAVVANPPFLGGLRTVREHGEPYAAYLSRLHPGLNKKTDLAAHFLRRAHALTRPKGRIGMIGTTTLTQGRTRRGSLEYLKDRGRRVVGASSSLRWPGEASLQVCVVHLGPESATEPCRLDGCEVSAINSQLRAGTEARPAPLGENKGLCFQGANFGGAAGFIVPAETALRWIAEDPRNREVVRPYVTGDDLGRTPLHEPPRWCVHFGERSKEEARRFPLPFAHLREHVFPMRRGGDARRYPRMVNQWWKFWHARLGLYAANGREFRWLMRTRVTKTHAIAVSPTHWVHSDGIVLFRLDSDQDFAVLQSSWHRWWALEFASSLAAAPRYIATDCFATFPRPLSPDPAAWAELGAAGARYLDSRQSLLRERGIGLTRFERIFHDPGCTDRAVKALRHELEMIDRWAALSYGWSPTRGAHDFRETALGVRYTVAEDARREALDRLYGLNRERQCRA